MRKKMYKAGKSWMVAAIAVGMIAAPITADIVGISSIQEGMTVHAQPTTTEPDTTYSAPPLFSSSVKASGTFGTANWYLDDLGILHIGPGQGEGISGTLTGESGHIGENHSNSGNFFTSTTLTGGITGTKLPSNAYPSLRTDIKQIYIDPGFKMPAYSARLFAEMPNLTAIYGLSEVDTSAMTDMNGIFAGDKNLTYVGDLSNWDVSNVTDMFDMIWGTKIEDMGNLDKWNVSKVTRMQGAFMNDPSLKNIGDLSAWNTSKVTNMRNMFNGASSLINIGNLDTWNTGNVTDMSGMFGGASSLTSIGDLSNWDMAKVSFAGSMFQGASSLENLGNLSNWNTSNIQNMKYMFGRTSSLTYIGDLSNWNTGNVTDMSGMFGGASSLTSIGDLSNWDMAKVSFASFMFNGASSLENLGNLSNWNTSNIQNMSYMFGSTSSLTYIGDLSNWNTGNVNNMSAMFFYAKKLSNIGDLSQWKTGKVTTFNGMFNGASSLENLGNLSNWDTSKVTSMSAMFAGDVLLSNIGDLSNWDTSKVGTMARMFSNVKNLNELNLLNWTVSSNTNIEDMFYDMTSLKKITFGQNWAASVSVPNAVKGSTIWQGATDTNNKFLATYKSSPVDVTGATNNADTYVLTPTAKTEIVTTDTLSGSAKVGDAQTGAISQTGKLSFTVAGSDKGTITMALAKESSNVISGLHLASVKDDTEGTAKDYDITAGASTQIGTYSTSGTHNYSIDPSKSNIKLNSKSADPGSYTAATTYTMNNTPNA